MTDVFRSSPPSVSQLNAISIAWGQLVLYDLSLTVDNTSEPFDIPCDDGGGSADVWCPLGEASEPIPFFRSDASVSDDSVRNPTNYATSFIDLDFVYGRSEEEARALRSFEGGFMNMTEGGRPFRNADGTWLVSRGCAGRSICTVIVQGYRPLPEPTFRARLLSNQECADTTTTRLRIANDGTLPMPPFSAPTLVLPLSNRALKIGQGSVR